METDFAAGRALRRQTLWGEGTAETDFAGGRALQRQTQRGGGHRGI